VLGIGDQHRAILVNAQVLGPVQRGLKRRAAAHTGFAGAGDGANLAAGVHHSQGVAAAFQDVQVPLGIDGVRPRIDERLLRGLFAVLGDAFLAVAGRGGDDAARQVDLADAAIVEVGDEAVLAGGVEANAVAAAELGLDRRAAVTGEALRTGARERRHDARL